MHPSLVNEINSESSNFELSKVRLGQNFEFNLLIVVQFVIMDIAIWTSKHSNFFR